MPTTLHLGDEDWSVETAEPVTRAEYQDSGCLHLVLRRVDVVDPALVGFSMPTICDVLPAFHTQSRGAEPSLALHEDVWRDVEVVSARAQDGVDANFSEIRRIVDAADATTGFDECHIRKQPARPLDGMDTTLRTLLGAFALDRSVVVGLAVQRHGEVVDGFAIPIAPGVHLYGRGIGGVVDVLGLHRAASAVLPADAAQSFADWLAAAGASLVDWSACRQLSSRADLVAYGAGSG